MIDLTDIITAVLALLASLITAYVVPWIKANATIKQQEMLGGVYRTLVYAAEQIYGAGRGEEKLEYVAQQLKAKGYTVDVDMIEATVKQHFGSWGQYDEDTPAEEESEEDEEPQTEIV